MGSSFDVEVFDWNQIEQAKSLGTGKIDLENLEPFTGATITIPLTTLKHGTKGELRISLLFQPSIIAKSRKNTSTFSSAGRAMTQVGSLPLGAGKGIVHGVGSAGKTVFGVFMRDHGISGSKTSLEVPPNGQSRGSIDDPPSTQLSRPADFASGASAGLPTSRIVPPSPTNGGGPGVPDDYNTLKITVLGAKDLVGASVGDSVKPYVIVKVGDKEQKTKHTAKTVAPEW